MYQWKIYYCILENLLLYQWKIYYCILENLLLYSFYRTDIIGSSEPLKDIKEFKKGLKGNPCAENRKTVSSQIGTGACVRACAYALRTAPLPPVLPCSCAKAPQGYFFLEERLNLSAQPHTATATFALFSVLLLFLL